MPDSRSSSPPFNADASPDSKALPWTWRAGLGVLSVVLVLGAVIGLTDELHSEAPYERLTDVPISPSSSDALSAAPNSVMAPRDLDAHPDVAFGDYFGASASGISDTSALVYKFRELLDLFDKRQRVDDNFTMRVIDNRTGRLLEVHALENERAAHRRGEPVDWRAVDDKRRRATRQLVDKYEARGIPREAITVKWGRANQVQEAHERNKPFAEYEMRLAQYLDLSLLPMEVGTVETFNQDHLVSSVGARSRYQMMPWLLRRNGIHRYDLPTTDGHRVSVKEELHPLLVMEPAFLLMRGYANAVGHAVPGLSAYHTGPGNIYKLYRLFLTESDNRFSPSASVMDAYIWAVTEGYDTVSEQSTFGPYSRGYVASAYGALRATDHHPIDTTQTLRTARMQLKPGASIPLQALLDTLDRAAVDWPLSVAEPATPYRHFQALNPHFELPSSSGGSIPEQGNVKLVSAVQGKAVEVFLPLGAPNALKQAGLDLFDDAATFHFDASTYASPSPAMRTKWDRAYDALVADIGRFGFTEDNRERLLQLHDRFETLATVNPSHYRQRQLQIIETHRRIWMSNPWEQLAETATLATGRKPLPVEPPAVLQTDSLATGLAPSVE